MKTYKIATLWLIASALRGILPIFLSLFTIYLVFIEQSFEFKAGVIIGTPASILFLWYGIKKTIVFLENFRRNTKIDESGLIIDDVPLKWEEIETITFQGAVEFGPAIIVTEKESGNTHEIPAFTGMLALIELGNTIEKHAFKHGIELLKPEEKVEKIDPDNKGKPASEEHADPAKALLARTYNMWLSGEFDHLNDLMRMQVNRVSFAGFLTMYEEDMNDLQKLNSLKPFDSDEFLFGAVTGSYLITNKVIFFHADESCIDLKAIKSYSSEGGGWSYTLNLELKNGETKRIENLDAIPTDEYFDFFMA